MAFAEYPVVSSSGGSGITKVADSTERNALSPADGDVVIQLDNDFLYEWNGSSWAVLADRTWQTAGSILGAKTFDSASTWSVATNQQAFGVTNTITVNYAAPSANRIYTVPDVGADAAYVLTAGNQTIGGTKTFSSAVVINPTTNQIVLGVTNTTTINSVAPLSSRIYTIPDAGADASFVMTKGTQVLEGTYTFIQPTLIHNVVTSSSGVYQMISSALNAQIYTEYQNAGGTAQTWRAGLNVDGSNVGSYVIYDQTSTTTRATITTAGQLQLPASSNQIRVSSGVNAVTITSGTSAAARTYTIPDAGTTADFVMSAGSSTIAGARTFSSAVTINPASNQLVLSSGVNQLTLNSGTSAAGRTYTIPDTGTTDTFVMLGGSQTLTGTKTFSSAVTVNAASNQLILSSGVNQLTIDSSTSAAARTYSFPDVGTTGTVAMLQGSQTFTGLKTFSSGLAVSGGSAANNTIWVASNVLNIRGGTSGTDIYNTSGTVVFDIADSGSVALGPSGQYGLRMESGTFANASTSFLANCYINATHAGRSDTARAGGGILVDAPSTDASNVITFYANLDNAATSTAATAIGSVLPTGAWTVGPSPFAALNHTVNGAIRASVTSSYHAFFRDTAGVDAATPLAVVRPGTENGSEVYISFLESGTSANNGSESGGIRRNSGDTAYEFYNTSDARLKTVLGSYSGGLEQVLNVPVRRFSWNSSPERDHFRWIAQEVQKYIPSAVFEGADGYLQMGESDLIPIMWNAIQELNAKLEAL